MDRQQGSQQSFPHVRSLTSKEEIHRMKPVANVRSSGVRAVSVRRFIASAFLLIGIGVVFATVFAAVQTRDLQTGTRAIVEEMVGRNRLLDQLDRLIERRRILVDDYLFTSMASERAGPELQIGAVDRQLSVAIHEYSALNKLPGERAIWDRARENLSALDGHMAQAIAFSRRDEDIAARQTMNRVGVKFEEINRELDQLDDINESASSTSLARVETVRRWLQLLVFGIGGVALAATVMLGLGLSRQVRRREQEISFEARALVARNRELDAFAGRVAHDIRSPLTSIKLVTSKLAMKVGPDDREIRILDRSSQRMDSLVEDLLTLALSEAAAMGTCDPAKVAQEVQDDFRGRIDRECGTLSLEVSPAQVPCSEGLLRQALTNLLENAVKYHRPDVPPQVTLVGATTNGGYDLRISDNGMGMSPEEADRAFEPFYRAPCATSIPGTGLGLSIVSRIAEVSGGSTSLQTKVGQGSTFVIHLPLACQGRSDRAD